MLAEQDLFGNVRDKIKRAVDIVKCFCPPEGFYLAYSGGKDSVVAKKILDLANVPYDAHYNVTTVDPPELVKFIISQFDAVVYEYHDGRPYKHFVVKNGCLHPGTLENGKVIYFSIPRLPMHTLIAERKMPPTRLMRYCCEELKEVAGDGRVVVTGVRAAESRNRKQNKGMVTFPDKKTAAVAEANNANFILTERGGWC
jgi:phosphoadenosine phosphosulfate reductase